MKLLIKKNARLNSESCWRLATHLLRLLGWLLAVLWLGWRVSWLIAPAPVSLPGWSQPEPLAASRQMAQRHWFGLAQPMPAPTLQLLGVFAPSAPEAGGGFAVLEYQGRVRHVLSGSDALEGWRLLRIAADGVWLQLGEQQQFYPLQSGRRPPEIFETGALAPPPPEGDD